MSTDNDNDFDMDLEALDAILDSDNEPQQVDKEPPPPDFQNAHESFMESYKEIQKYSEGNTDGTHELSVVTSTQSADFLQSQVDKEMKELLKSPKKKDEDEKNPSHTPEDNDTVQLNEEEIEDAFLPRLQSVSEFEDVAQNENDESTYGTDQFTPPPNDSKVLLFLKIKQTRGPYSLFMHA